MGCAANAFTWVDPIARSWSAAVRMAYVRTSRVPAMTSSKPCVGSPSSVQTISSSHGPWGACARGGGPSEPRAGVSPTYPVAASPNTTMTAKLRRTSMTIPPPRCIVRGTAAEDLRDARRPEPPHPPGRASRTPIKGLRTWPCTEGAFEPLGNLFMDPGSSNSAPMTDALTYVALTLTAAEAIALVILARAFVRHSRKGATIPQAPIATASTAPAPTPAVASSGELEDVFVLHRSGLLLKHYTRRLRPNMDSDVLSGMLAAVQGFIKDAFREEAGTLDEIQFGDLRIRLSDSKSTILAALIPRA